MNYELALCSRVVREPAAMPDVLKYGITPDDFMTAEGKHFWSLLLSYYSRAETKGGVLDESTMKQWFKSVSLHDHKPGLPIDALCYEVRRTRLVVQGNAAVVAFCDEVGVPIADPVAAAQKLRNAFDDILRVGASTGTNLRTAVDLAGPLPRARWVVEGLGLQPGAPMLLAGYGSSQKSFAAQSLALSLAAPESLLVWGRFARGRRCRVLHLDYEQGEVETQRRYQRLARGMALDLASLGTHLATRSFGDQLLLANRAVFERYAKDADVIIIDSFAAARGSGVEENNAEAREPLDMLTAISAETGCTFIVIHHSGKGTKADPREVARGSSAIFDAAGAMLSFTRDMEKNEVRVAQAKNRGGPENEPFTLRVADAPGGGITILADTVPNAQTELTVLAERIVMHLEVQGGSWTGSTSAFKRELNVSNRKHQLLQQALSHLVQSRRLHTGAAGGGLQTTTYRLMADPLAKGVPEARDNLRKRHAG